MKKNFFRKRYFFIVVTLSVSVFCFFPHNKKNIEVQAAAGNPQQPYVYIPFDGNAIPAINSPGNSVNPPSNLPYSTGIVGQALKVGNGVALGLWGKWATAKSGTAMIWVKPVDWKSGDGKGSGFFNLIPGIQCFTFGSNNNFSANFMFIGYPGNELTYGGADFAPDHWTQIVITWLDSTLRIYADGKLVLDGGLRAPFTDADLANSLDFGSWPQDATKSTLLDEFYTYDYALSSAEISQVYNSYFNGSTSHLPISTDTKFWAFHFPAHYQIQAYLDLTHNNFGGQATQAEIVAKDANNATYSLGTLTNVTNGLVSSFFDLPKSIPAGPVTVSAKIKNNAGTVLDTLTTDSFQKKTFWWESSNAGESDDVIAPFTPIQTAGKTFSVYGRDYTLKDDGFPSAITSKSASLLAAPIALSGTDDHGALSFTNQGTLQTISSAPGKVSLKGTSTADGGRVKVENNIDLEYDGMMKYTMKITPDAGGVNFTNLHLDIPINDVNAKLYHFVDSTNATGYNGHEGYVPAGSGTVWSSLDPVHMASNRREMRLGTFIPYFWLGDYDRGLSFMTDNDKGWISDDNNAEVEFVRQNGQLIARLNLFNKSQTINQPREIIFALEASPARPEPANWRAADTGGDPDWSNWMHAAGTAAFQGYAHPPDEAYFKSNARGNQTNMGYSVANYSPWDWRSGQPNTEENSYFIKEWGGGVDFSGAISPVRNQCTAAYTEKYINDPGGTYIDGMFSDNSYPVGSSDSGYVRDDGSSQTGFAMFELRDYYKRLAYLFRKNNLKRSMMIHMTGAMVVPAYSFWDSKSDNEANTDQVSNMIASQDLSGIAARSMASQYGMASIWHTGPRCWMTGDPVDGGAGIGALLLLHDVLASESSCAAQERPVEAKKMFDIGQSDVEFMGYWALQPEKNPNDKNDGPKMSAWVRKSQQTALITIANLTSSDWTGDISIPLTQLGLNANTVFADGEYPFPKMNLNNGKLSLSIPKQNFAIVLAGPAGAFPVDFQTTFEKPASLLPALSDNFNNSSLSSAWKLTCLNNDCAGYGQGSMQAYRNKLQIQGGDYNQIAAERSFNQDNVSVQVRVDRQGDYNDSQGLALVWGNGKAIFAGPVNYVWGKFRYDVFSDTLSGGYQEQLGSAISWGNPGNHNWVRIDLQPDKIIFYGSADGKTWSKDWELARPADLAGAPAALRLGKSPLGRQMDTYFWSPPIYFDDLIVGKNYDSDLNVDTKVDATDFTILKTDFLRLTASLANPKSDINQDGQATIKDVGIMMSGWKP